MTPLPHPTTPDMQADQDLHYSAVHSTTAMKTEGPDHTTRTCRLIKTFTIHQYILQQPRFFPCTVKVLNILQEHVGWSRPSYSPVHSTTAMKTEGPDHTTRTCKLIRTFTIHQQNLREIFSMNSEGSEHTTRTCRLIRTFTIHQQNLQQPIFFPWPVKALNILQGHAGWPRHSLFTSRFCNSQDSFRKQHKPWTYYKNMQADLDLPIHLYILHQPWRLKALIILQGHAG